MVSSTKKVYQVAVVVFDGGDILDFAGPVEMLSHITYNQDRQNPEHGFKIHIVARKPTIHAAGDALTVTADLTLEEASKRLDDFDIVVVPGGPPEIMMPLVESDSPELQFVRNFATSAPSEGGRDERVILSVCTGALLVGATGAVGGLTLTTHHMGYDLLRQVCEKASKDGKAVHVAEDHAQRRYVDGGANSVGVRVITAGGVTCGLDASLHLAALKVGDAAAEFAANMTEHEWKRAA